MEEVVPISLESLKPSYMVEVNLGQFCNFRCSYCFEHNKDQSLNNTDVVDKLERNWYKVSDYLNKTVNENLGIKVQFLGGETTLYPLESLIRKIASLNHIQGFRIFTNGTNVDYVIRLNELCQELKVDFNVNVSYHDEFMSIEKYIDVLKRLRQNFISIAATSVATNENIRKLIDDRAKMDSELGYHFAIQRATVNNAPCYFSDENYKFFKNAINADQPCVVPEYARCLYMSDTSRIYGDGIVDIEAYIGKELKTLGAECNVGQSFLYIQKDGTCSFGHKFCGSKSANMFTDDIIDLGNPIVTCAQDRCNCLYASKVNFKWWQN